uniref:Si:dkeyp-104h9.5 n=1 Tax=Eptatretus burgeri TaxID=7764 RepID=A0A8C4X072_EPTBU
MWVHQRMKSLPIFSSTWVRRVFVVSLTLVVVLWWYTVGRYSHVPRGGARPAAIDRQDPILWHPCMQPEISAFEGDLARGDAVFAAARTGDKDKTLAFVGSGLVGLEASVNRLFASSGGGDGIAEEMIDTGFAPLVSVQLDKEKPAEGQGWQAAILNLRKGYLSLLQCLQQGAVWVKLAGGSAAASDAVTPGRFGVAASGSVGRGTKSRSWVVGGWGSDVDRVPTVWVAVGSVETLWVPGLAVWVGKVGEDETALRARVKREGEKGREWGPLTLLSLQGIEISQPDPFTPTPTGLMANLTLYYLLSAMPMGPGNQQSGGQWRTLNSPERCFSGHATLHAPGLWVSHMHSVAEVRRLAGLWKLTLEKRGCRSLVETGPQGVVQAVTLSFIALHFTEQHLAIEAEPAALHCSFTLRGIRYGRATLRLAVSSGSGPDPEIRLWLRKQDLESDSTSSRLYACPAGCPPPPVVLDTSPGGLAFPALVTHPLTALLYISPDAKHLVDVAATLHVRSVLGHAEHMAGERPAFPPTLAIGLASLLILFHLWLLKLVYNEYCGLSNRHRT